MKHSVRVILYGMSSFMDMVAGTLLFVVPVRAARLGASYSLIGALGVAWSLGAVLMTLLIGRFVNEKNSALLCVFGCLLQAVFHACLIVFASTAEAMLPFMFIIGLTHIVFYVPYQVFFKTVSAAGNMPLAASVGLYTFAWSLGMAIGPFWSGFLMRESLWGLAGWQLCFIFTILSCVLVAGAVVVIQRISPRGGKDQDLANDVRPPDFAKIAWLSALCGAFAFSLVRGLFPAGAVYLGVPEDIQGGVIFCMGFLQAISGFFLGRILHWMYNPKLLAYSGLMGFLGMVCFLLAFLGVVDGTAMIAAFFAGAFLFGLYSGSFYFYTVFHNLAHPSRAGFNIAVNEGMYAISNVIGLFLGGILADWLGIAFPYLAAALLIVFFTAVQVRCHAKTPWPDT